MIGRRHLTQEQKQRLVREQIKETPERSDRQIAGDIGVSNSTVSLTRKAMEKSGDVCESHTSIDTLDREQPRKHKAPESGPAAQEAADEPVPQGNGNNFINEPDTSEQKPSDSEDIQKENKAPARKMTMADDLRMALRMETDGLDSVLKGLLDDYHGYEEMQVMLFSPEGINIALEGLTDLKEVVDKYERIVRARERKP